MTSQIRRKIASKILESFKSDYTPGIDDFARKLRLTKRISCKNEPISFQIPVTWCEKHNENFPAESEALVNTFKNDDIITSVQFDSTHRNILFSVDSRKFVQEMLNNVLKPPNIHEKSILKNIAKQNLIIEFSSPNIAKPFHAGHLRSTIIGNFIGNIFKFAGHEVTSLNYLGDWGTQFGLLSLGYEMMGSDAELRKDPINHLFKIYVEINKLAKTDANFYVRARENFRNLEEGDEVHLNKWKMFRQLSVDDLNAAYQRLGINFSEFHGESMYRQETLSGLLNQMRQSGLLKTIDGAEVVNMYIGHTHKKIPLVKSDGSTLYLTRDIAAAIDRFHKYKFDHMYYVVENGQHDHFEALSYILNKMNQPWCNKLHHVKFGRIHNMSTRKGTVVFLKDIIEEGKIRMLESMKKSPNTKVNDNLEEVATQLSISAVFVNDMKNRRNNEYDFDWERCLFSKGDSGVQLQYTHSRLCSLQKNCGITFDSYDETCLTEPEAIDLIHCLSRFEEVLEDAYEKLEPCIIVVYLFHLRKFIGSAVKKLQVKGTEPHIAQARLALFTASKQVLCQGLKIIGVTPLESM